MFTVKLSRLSEDRGNHYESNVLMQGDKLHYTEHSGFEKGKNSHFRFWEILVLSDQDKADRDDWTGKQDHYYVGRKLSKDLDDGRILWESAQIFNENGALIRQLR